MRLDFEEKTRIYMLSNFAMFWSVLLASFAVSSAWICGNEGQCVCTNSGEVLCSGVSTTPNFPSSYRQGRRLTLELDDREFDISSLTQAEGFDTVLILGLPGNLCDKTERLFPFAVCVLTRTVEFIVTNTEYVTERTSRTPVTAEPRRAAQATSSSNKGLIAWVVVASIVGIVIVSCILVSLVNLHARINSHSRSQDPPLFAVDCCLRCMAVLMCPLHICARLFRCRENCLYSLERRGQVYSRPFSA